MFVRRFGATAAVAAACTSAWPLTSPQADDAGASDAAAEDRSPPGDPDAGDGSLAGPDRISQSGLYSDVASRTIAPGILPYEPRWPFWSDGAAQRRFLYLPPDTTIDTTDMDNWTYPVGTKVWREFRINGLLVETRFLWKERLGADGWWEMGYAWLPDGSDAVAAPGGVTGALGTTLDVPSRWDCPKCHVHQVDVLIGVSAMQLGASDGDGTLAKLVAARALSNAPAKSAFDVPGSGVVKNALGYLHGNCGECHNDTGLLKAQTPIRLKVKVADASPQDCGAYRTTIGVKMVHSFPTDAGAIDVAILPGDPDRSQLWWRMAQRGQLGMPWVDTKVVDPYGTQVVRDWILQMDQ